MGEQEKEIEQEGTKFGTGRLPSSYEESRRLWREFRKGRLTATELGERLGQYENSGEADKIKELFNGKELK